MENFVKIRPINRLKIYFQAKKLLKIHGKIFKLACWYWNISMEFAYKLFT